MSCQIKHLRADDPLVRLQRDFAGQRQPGDIVPELSAAIRLTLAFTLALAGCVAQPPDRIAAFRPKGAPIYSAAAFDVGRITGEWQQVASYAAGPGPGCAPGRAAFGQGPVGLQLTARLCLNGTERVVSGPVQMVGPGRLSVPGMADWWVIWVDSGYRTLAIGTPDGSFGFVLDRGRAPPDRLSAAAEIFDFNGYPKSRFTPF